MPCCKRNQSIPMTGKDYAGRNDKCMNLLLGKLGEGAVDVIPLTFTTTALSPNVCATD